MLPHCRTLPFLVSLLHVLSISPTSLSWHNSPPECPYPCLPPPMSVSNCPPPPPPAAPTTPAEECPPPPPEEPSWGGYPPPEPATPGGYYQQPPPPPPYYIFPAPPPPNPILPWFPWYYKTPPSANSAVSLPPRCVLSGLVMCSIAVTILWLTLF